MRKKLSVLVCGLLMLAASGVPSSAGASDTGASGSERRPVILLLPDEFRGWACVDFGVTDAPPLPREGDSLVIRPRPGEILKTSDTPASFALTGTAWIEVGGQRHALPHDVYARIHSGLEDSKNPVRRECVFFGTEDEADAAEDAPGIGSRSGINQGVSQEEREALVVLYEATGGSHWKHRVGWLGPPGTECQWHGVRCSVESGRAATVSSLHLEENNLVGSIPEAVGKLAHLQWLSLFDNHLTGRLPEPLMRRWLAGPLALAADPPLLTNVSEISLESHALSLLCARHRVTLQSDGRVRRMATRCRAATPNDRTTFCELKEGHLFPGEFARLGVLIEKNGFSELRGEYSRNVIDSGVEIIRVNQDGKWHQVRDHAGAAPFELWVIGTAIEGAAAVVEWDKTTTQTECPWSNQ